MEMKDALKNLLSHLDEQCHHKYDSRLIMTGIDDLDAKCSGFKPNELIVIASRPSMGKSIFCRKMLEKLVLEDNKTIAYFSFEHTVNNILMFILSSATDIPVLKLKRGEIKNDDWQYIAELVQRLRNRAAHLFDTPILTIDEICNKCNDLDKDSKLDAVIIDDIHLIDNFLGLVKKDAMSLISHKLKVLAKTLEIPIIVTTALSRYIEEDEQRENFKPTLTDLRDAGVLAEIADKVLFLYRDEIYDENSIFPGSIEIIIKKDVYGNAGSILLDFDKEFANSRLY